MMADLAQKVKSTNGPRDSQAIGCKTECWERRVYFDSFLAEAISAVPRQSWRKHGDELASVLTSVTSQVSSFPACHRMRARPSCLVRPTGFLVTGMSTEVMTHYGPFDINKIGCTEVC